jgi:hypothetical protein
MNQYVGTGDSPSFVNVYATSDRRLKTNIRSIENALDLVIQLEGVRYQRISNGSDEIGVIAQDLQEVLPELVNSDINGYLSVAYGNISALLIQAIKELKIQIDQITKS